MDLLPFQVEASTQIADRFADYSSNPLLWTKTRPVAFYQNLSAITGSGKTLILADSVEQIRVRMPIEPIVLWLSKGKVVVTQTFASLTGKYAPLIGGFKVKPLLDCTPSDVTGVDVGLLLVATVAKFNQRDKEEGGRKIFKVGLDAADESLWTNLRKRRDEKGRRRPLIIVYDEGHNLSDQQTKLLDELEPDALLAASATLRVPAALAKTIERLRDEKKWKDGDFITSVPSPMVVEAGLVKKHISLGGYVSPMELCIDDLLREMKSAEKSATSQHLAFRPKAIYVSSTNVVDGTTKGDLSRPFAQRRARPILIWRHLVENCRVDPATIAVYCGLNFDKKFPAPAKFNLFSGGDDDYERFMAGGYRHIIFNLGLQEGWDDPECYFAYIDKEMGSPDQVTQVVGRVLRQPGLKHYSENALNTAHFYIRTDEKGVFESIIEDVRDKISSQMPEISISVVSPSGRRDRKSVEPKKKLSVPFVSINSVDACEPVQHIVDEIMDFRSDVANTVGKGAHIQVLQSIGSGKQVIEEWVEVEHSNRVTARWMFIREIQRRRPKALGLCDIEHPKFDCQIEYHSRAAAHLREAAEKVVNAYIALSTVVQNPLDQPYIVGSLPVIEGKCEKFINALHGQYSELNDLEKAFARAIDKTKKPWARNPATGGFAIDLLDHGKTRQFKPDFLIWANKMVIAIDTKGDHLIHEAAVRKLFDIPQVAKGDRLVVRLVTEGHWQMKNGVPERLAGTEGFTVWRLKQGKVHATQCGNALGAVQDCLTA